MTLSKASTGTSLITRSAVAPAKDYKAYRPILRTDFFHSCAYCTICEFEAQSIRMTIDHYEPRTARPDLANIYHNLMYACTVCNERKGNRYPPLSARAHGHRFYRPDEDARGEHFEAKGIRLCSLTPVGEFTIQMLDLNRHALLTIRRLRDRMTQCEPLVTEGIMALRTFRIDQLPQHIKGRANTTIQKIGQMATSMREDIDSILLSYAKSELIDPDDSAKTRSKERDNYFKEIRALYPGQNFRPPR